MAPELKSEVFMIRMGATEASMLRELAEKSGLTRTDVVRQLIRREHGALFATEAKPKRPKRK